MLCLSSHWPWRSAKAESVRLRWGAVIGGVAAPTPATLTVLPLVFGVYQRRASLASASLRPKHDVSESSASEQTRESE